MAKGFFIIIVSCLCLIFILQTNLLNAASQGNPFTMQEHIEEVKRKNPAAYQEMVDKAGGVIINCLSCHIDINKKKSGAGQTTPR